MASNRQLIVFVISCCFIIDVLNVHSVPATGIQRQKFSRNKIAPVLSSLKIAGLNRPANQDMNNETVLSNTSLNQEDDIISNKKNFVKMHILANQFHVKKNGIQTNAYSEQAKMNNPRGDLNQNPPLTNIENNTEVYSTAKEERSDGSEVTYFRTNAELTPRARLINENKLTHDKKANCTCQKRSCDCSTCNLSSVPQYLDRNITELLLYNNNLKSLPAFAFLRYNLLEHLDLCYNSVSNLNNDSFNGLTRLLYLNFSNNKLLVGQLPLGVFKPLNSLKLLRINKNELDSMVHPSQELAFAYLHNVEELYMDNTLCNPYTRGFDPVFKNLTSLRHLTIDCLHCSLGLLISTTFENLGQITLLNISNCNIVGQDVEKGTLSHLTNLEILDVSDNPYITMEYLPLIMWGLRDSSLHTLRMNRIVDEFSPSTVDFSVMGFLPETLSTIIARQNNIIEVQINIAQIMPKSLKTLDISKNYIVTNPLAFHYEAMESLETLIMNSYDGECIIDPDNDSEFNQLMFDNQLQHTQTETKEGQNVAVGSHRSQDGRSIPPNLKRVKMNVKRMPYEFLKYFDSNNNLETLDLSCSYFPYFNFWAIQIFQKLRFCNLRSSYIREFSLPSLKMSSLEVLIFKDNNLNGFSSTAAGGPFDKFNNLVHLDLSRNQITHVPKYLLRGLDKLQNLLISGNKLSHFDVDISNMTQLKVLNLSFNQLSYLSNEVRSHIDHLSHSIPAQIKVDMSECPIQCNCLNLGFLKWMVNSAAFDKNYTNYKCSYPDTSVRYVLDGYQDTILRLERECALNYPMFLLVLASTLILVCAVIGFILYRFRWKIRYLYYAAYLKLKDSDMHGKNQEFQYDVFISYDSEDEDFVTEALFPELEKRGLIVLLHGRDFVAGEYIGSNIAMAVANSRKTLVVLTRHLLHSSWCNYELQMANMEAVHSGRRVLVFLLKENIPSKELDLELLGYIRSNTYMPYPSLEDDADADVMKGFYDKLNHDLRC